MEEEIKIFSVTLTGEYLRLYNELLNKNPEELVQQKLIEAGFHKLAEMKKRGEL